MVTVNAGALRLTHPGPNHSIGVARPLGSFPRFAVTMVFERSNPVALVSATRRGTRR
jgi:hypothetical protein